MSVLLAAPIIHNNNMSSDMSVSTSTPSKPSASYTLDEIIPIIQQHITSSPSIVYIMRGIPGMGKSSLASMIEQIASSTSTETSTSPSCLTVSADHFFMHNGVYQYDGRLIGQAHATCFGTYIDVICKHTHNIIIVDNTNTTTWEYANYIKLAKHMGWTCYVMEIYQTSALIDRLCTRNTHNVPISQCQTMFRRWEQHDDTMCPGYIIQPYIPPTPQPSQEQQQQQQQQQHQHQHQQSQQQHQDTPRVWRSSPQSSPSHQSQREWNNESRRWSQSERRDDRYTPYPQHVYHHQQPSSQQSSYYARTSHSYPNRYAQSQQQQQSSSYHQQSRFAGLEGDD